MHATNAGKKRKALKKEAQALAKDAKVARKATKTLPEASQKASEMESQVDELEAKAEALKTTSRLEDLHIWQMEKVKTTKKGSRSYGYWMVTKRDGGKTRNVHLGSCQKLDGETIRQKAREMKTAALSIKI
jgi:hypothetical protein